MVGEKLGSFQVSGTLGVGAMGVVYKAVHEPTGKWAAVKVVNKDIAQRGKTYERFQREAEILQQFRHPNIVRFLAVGRYQGTSYIAMEFIQGKTLEQLLEERGALPWREVVDLGVQMCDALQYAHEHGVVHRDLKPSNLMVTDDGRVKLTDFGIAKDLDKTALTATGRTLGTAAYMAPEQIRGTPEVSHKTDLYALGCVFYQMLTGQPPFSGTSHVVLMHCHLNEPVPRPSAKVAEIPKALDDLVVQLMAKAPADRPWDAAASGVVLNEVREKAKKGETVPMVWPTDGDGTSLGTVSGVTAAAAVKKPKKAKHKAPAADGPWSARRALETAGLVAALFAIGGLIAYMVWPPSRDYLFHQAEALMNSPDAHKWREAQEQFLDPLDRRFADHPYKATTDAWRDKIMVSEIEGRAKMIQSPADTPFNRPKGDVENRWVAYYARVSAAQKANDDPAALAAWEELAESYRPKDSAERAWHLLAKRNAEELKKAMAERRALVTGLIARVHQAELAGKQAEADGLRKEVRERYGRYPDLADLIGPAEEPAPEPAAPAPASDK